MYVCMALELLRNNDTASAPASGVHFIPRLAKASQAQGKPAGYAEVGVKLQLPSRKSDCPTRMHGYEGACAHVEKVVPGLGALTPGT